MLSAFSHAPCVTVRLSWRVTWKRRKSEKEKPLVSLFRRRRRAAVVGTRAARRRSSSCVLETPLAFFWPSTSMTRVFKQSAKSVNAPPNQNRFKPHKAVVLAKREIPSEAPRHLHARVPGCTARVRTEGHASSSLCPCARGSCEGAARGRARSSPRPRNSRNPTGGGFPNANRGIPRGFATP